MSRKRGFSAALPSFFAALPYALLAVNMVFTRVRVKGYGLSFIADLIAKLTPLSSWDTYREVPQVSNNLGWPKL